MMGMVVVVEELPLLEDYFVVDCSMLKSNY